METNIHNRSRLDVPLSEPHFDEEATLMTARPVVPLEEVQAKERTSKRVMFFVALTIALIVGGLAGAAVHKYRSDARIDEMQANDGDAEHASQPAITTRAGGQVGGSQANAPGDESARETEIASVDSSPTESIGQPARDSEVSASPRRSRRTVNNAAANDDRNLEIRRAERREAGRQRREAEHQARRSRQNSDDLLRIREIFEGSPRP
jgi:hypothetical protein